MEMFSVYIFTIILYDIHKVFHSYSVTNVGDPMLVTDLGDRYVFQFMQLLLLNREIVKMSDDEMSKKQQRAAQYRRRQVSS